MWGCWLQWSSWGTNSVTWRICLSLYQPDVSSVSSAGPKSVLDPFTSFGLENPILYRPRVSWVPVVELSHPGRWLLPCLPGMGPGHGLAIFSGEILRIHQRDFFTHSQPVQASQLRVVTVCRA